MCFYVNFECVCECGDNTNKLNVMEDLFKQTSSFSLFYLVQIFTQYSSRGEMTLLAYKVLVNK